MPYIDCKELVRPILDAVKAIPNKKSLVIYRAGKDPASDSYILGKLRDCEYCGIPCEVRVAETEQELIYDILKRREDEDVGGIIVQLPLPQGWDADKITNLVPPHLDVDGFVANSKFKPCTAEGIMYLLHKRLGSLAGLTATVVGRGQLVGKPVAEMLLEENCTVTVAHSHTRALDLDQYVEHSDIVVCGANVPKCVYIGRCRLTAVVVDAGIFRGEDGKLQGNCYGKIRFLGPDVTPVPGGVGLLTRAMLMAHVARLDVNTL